MSEIEKAAPISRPQIDLSDDDDVSYWTEKLGVSRERLERTISIVGTNAEAVAEEISKG